MRAILIVLDSVGIGALPDAAGYGDAGSNTLLNIKKKVPEMDLKNMNRLGLSNIDGASGLSDTVIRPEGSFCKLAESSKGKDTTTGHWEIAGLNIETAFPTYPNGFPKELIERFEKEIGRKTLGNCVASGTEIIERLGDRHVETGFPIVYTSADSVFQIAAHEDIIPIDEQYLINKIAREKILTAPNNVARVIARPFTGVSGNYKRTANRKDFSLAPFAPTMLDYIKSGGLSVAAVGKIEDIFAGRGITESLHNKDNMHGVDNTLHFMDIIKNGLIFTNLVDFDMLFGHRNDYTGYAKALMDFDNRLPEIISKLRDDDILFLTADHGCDPTMPGTDHSREYIPLLIYGKEIKAGVNLHTRNTYADIAATILDYLKIGRKTHGASFLPLVTVCAYCDEIDDLILN